MTSMIYMALSRAVLTDMIFSIFVVISIGFFSMAYFHPKYKTAGIYWAFVFSAIAVLTKGVLGFTFPAGCVLLFLIYKINNQATAFVKLYIKNVN